MDEKRYTTEQSADMDRIGALLSVHPPEKRDILRAITEAVILGAQIAEQCAETLSTQKDAS